MISFGLTHDDLRLITTTLERYPEVSEAIIFGSRVRGTFKPGSDVDIALKGERAIHALPTIQMVLNEELPLPYMFDLVDFATIESQALLEHIQTHGVQLYLRR